MKDKVAEIFDLLQRLDVKSTENNVTMLSYVLRTLREIYTDLPEETEATNE